MNKPQVENEVTDMDVSDCKDTTNAEESSMDISPSLDGPPHDNCVFMMTKTVKNALLSGAWLTCCVMAMVQFLLRMQFPKQNGLQDCLRLYKKQEWNSQPKDFIQIVYIENHWVCVSNIFCPRGVVYVYDSSGRLSKNQIWILCMQLAIILNVPIQEVEKQHPDVQSQNGDSDCGLFAIAFAIALCNRDDPSKLSFDQHKMRPHLVECFATGKMTPFPLANGPKRQ